MAFPFPLLFSGVLSSLDPALTNPMLVFGRLGGGTTSLSSAWERVVSERPEVPRSAPVPMPLLGEPSEKRNGLVFPGCVVEGRFKGDAGRGIFDGDGGGATLDELPVLVDEGTVESPSPTVEDFALMKIFSDVCLNLLGSGGGFDTKVDLGVVSGGFDFEVTALIGFGGRGLEATVFDTEGKAAS